MGEDGTGVDEARAGEPVTAGPEALQARLQGIVEREVLRVHGALVEECEHLRERVRELERDNRKLQIKSETVDDTLRQLRQGGGSVRYYDANGIEVDREAVTG